VKLGSQAMDYHWSSSEI